MRRERGGKGERIRGGWREREGGGRGVEGRKERGGKKEKRGR